jgi:choline dehydrogenase-like flavoprotein
MNQSMTADVVIVGSGVAGSLVAEGLARRGIDVIMLEAGPKVDRPSLYATMLAAPNDQKLLPTIPYPNTFYAPHQSDVFTDYYVQEEATSFLSNYERIVGGTTWHWMGECPRLLPSDFQMKSTYGVGVDWPLSYEDLEPWYTAAEIALGVSGDAQLSQSPRTAAYPMPPTPMSYSDKVIQTATAGMTYQGNPLTITPTPQARNSIPDYNGRPRCCGAHNCIPLCPVGAKYDAMIHVERAIEKGVRLIPESVACNMSVRDDGLIESITVRRPDASEFTVRAKVFVLAAHAIETPKLLLISALDRFPNGVANSSDQVGRNLMDHPGHVHLAEVPERLYQLRGPVSISEMNVGRNGPWRSTMAAFRLGAMNTAWDFGAQTPQALIADLIAAGTFGTKLPDDYAALQNRRMNITSMVEQLPDPSNRIVPDFTKLDGIGIPRPKLHWTIEDYSTQASLEAKNLIGRIFAAMGATKVIYPEWTFGAGHIMGTYVMGSDPRTSVVDPDLVSHDHRNLVLEGSGVFPTSGTANPTLTLAALALRSVATIAQLAKTSPISL